MINSNGKDLSNFSMLDLFRSEMEIHAARLNDGLLSLENDTAGSSKSDIIEAMMRAAHSIKGGARIVELDPAVKLAHTMEDCFVSMQKGEIGLGAEQIDILLKGVDMLIKISESADEETWQGWQTANQKQIDELIANIAVIPSKSSLKMSANKKVQPDFISEADEKKAPIIEAEQKTEKPDISDISQDIMSEPEIKPEISSFPPPAKQKIQEQEENKQLSKPSEIQPAPSQIPNRMPAVSQTQHHMPAKEQKQPKPSQDKDRMVKVTALKIERLIALAGEVVVSSRWLPPFAESLLRLKKTQAELLNLLEKMQEEYETGIQKSEYRIQNTEYRIQNKSKYILSQSYTSLSKTEKFRTPHSGFEKMLDQAKEKAGEANQYLLSRINQLEMFTGASENLSDRLYHEIVGVRMRPFADGISAFPRMVRDLARELDKKIKFDIIGKSTEVDRDILEKLEAPLSHLIRNAIDHGIEHPHERISAGKSDTGTLRLEAAHRSGMLMITVSDDGRGVDPEKLRKKILEKGLTSSEMIEKLSEPELMEFLFLPGFSTLDSVTEISGRGVGLDVVHSMVHEVRGIVRAISKLGKGTTFHLELPLTLSVIRTFIVEITKEMYAFPLARIDRCLMLSEQEIEIVEDRQYFRFGNKNISLVDMRDILELEKSEKQEKYLSIVVISDRVHSYGLVVDKFLGESSLVVRPLDPRLGKLSDISSMAVMLDGSPVLIFDIEDLIRSIDNMLSGRHRFDKINYSAEVLSKKKAKHILVVDDSITVREMERKLLISKGYEVDVAVDGMEAWNLVRTNTYDMIVSDIDMPRMNGFELISNIKQHERLKILPVMIVSYKNKEEDRLRGLEIGANYYLTKSGFQDNSFINAVLDLIGEAYD